MYGDLAFAEVELGFVPAERDLLLVEAGDLVRDVAVEGDAGELLHVARALHRLQGLCGTIPLVKGKGPLARQLADVLLRLRREKGPQAPAVSSARPQIDALIVLDRSVDLVTPLCTQLTYEGLCDEIIRIVNGAIELPSDADPTSVKKVRLNSSDALFQQLRDLDFGRAQIRPPPLSLSLSPCEPPHSPPRLVPAERGVRPALLRLRATRRPLTMLQILSRRAGARARSCGRSRPPFSRTTAISRAAAPRSRA